MPQVKAPYPTMGYLNIKRISRLRKAIPTIGSVTSLEELWPGSLTNSKSYSLHSRHETVYPIAKFLDGPSAVFEEN